MQTSAVIITANYTCLVARDQQWWKIYSGKPYVHSDHSCDWITMKSTKMTSWLAVLEMVGVKFSHFPFTYYHL